MNAIININLMNLQGCIFKVEKIDNGLYYINVPFLNDFITLSFLENQITIL